MDEDKTIWLKAPQPLIVQMKQGNGALSRAVFTDAFKIGRDKTCQFQVKDSAVSRFHVEIRFDGDAWQIRDLDSANGSYLNGNRIKDAEISSKTKLELGKGGPVLLLQLEEDEEEASSEEEPANIPQTTSVTQVFDRYFTATGAHDAGDHTMAIRRAFERVKKKQSKKYGALIGVALILLIAAGALVTYQQIKINRLKSISEDIFYNMKTLEIEVTQIEEIVLSTANAAQRAEISNKRKQIKEMENSYDRFLDEMSFYGKNLSEEDQLIFKMARVFGECEVNMPKGFVKEVKKYIQKWKSSGRLAGAIQKAKEKGYIYRVTGEMLSNQLPPQFFYLGLQESNFNDHAVGPPTRFGIAKGIWQFLPTTASEYGLHTGPLIEVPRYDPNDERYDFDKATHAASRYIKKIYNTHAQASGLLVMASYNWGENNIRQMLNRMPLNPRERNFWKLLEQNDVPEETYDYVYYIFSAAVIGENPKLFGFDFDNPIPKMG
jgi:membrane-bound lytic murein transglycosylase D